MCYPLCLCVMLVSSSSLLGAVFGYTDSRFISAPYDQIVVQSALHVSIHLHNGNDTPQTINITHPNPDLVRRIVAIVGSSHQLLLSAPNLTSSQARMFAIDVTLNTAPKLITIYAQDQTVVSVHSADDPNNCQLVLHAADNAQIDAGVGGVNSLHVQLDGTSVVGVSGVAQVAVVDVQGSARYAAGGLHTTTTTIHVIKGSADLTVSASAAINGDVDYGAAVMHYRGQPTIGVVVQPGSHLWLDPMGG